MDAGMRGDLILFLVAEFCCITLVSELSQTRCPCQVWDMTSFKPVEGNS